MNRTFITLALTVVAAIIPRVATADIVLDDFTNIASVIAQQGPPVVPVSIFPNPNTLNQVGLPSGVHGGSRTLTSTITAGPQFGTAQLLSNAGTLSYSTGDNIVGDFSLSYSNIGSLDLSVAAFQFEVTSNDNGGTFTLTLTDSTNSSASSDLIVPEDGLGYIGDSLGIKDILIGGNGDFLSLNLSAITSITLSFSSNSSTDIGLSGLGFLLPGAVPSATPVVPEPASMLAWGSIIGLGWIASRRNRLMSRRGTKPAVA